MTNWNGDEIGRFASVDFLSKAKIYKPSLVVFLRMFEALKHGARVGIILCKEKDQTIIKYSVLEESEYLFASGYSLVLPSEDALKAVLEQVR